MSEYLILAILVLAYSITVNFSLFGIQADTLLYLCFLNLGLLHLVLSIFNHFSLYNCFFFLIFKSLIGEASYPPGSINIQ